MARDDSNLIWWIIGIILVLLWLGSSSEPSYDNCYDADPTQWTDMVCDY
jgi:hypothetical protein